MESSKSTLDERQKTQNDDIKYKEINVENTPY